MKPLTIEQLKALPVGEWVWLVIKRNYGDYKSYDKIVKINDREVSFVFSVGQNIYSFIDYGKTWLAWKNKEQAEAKGEIMELPCRVEIPLTDDGFVYNIAWDCENPPRVHRQRWIDYVYACLLGCGDNYFATKSAAEAKLAKLKGEK